MVRQRIVHLAAFVAKLLVLSLLFEFLLCRIPDLKRMWSARGFPRRCGAVQAGERPEGMLERLHARFERYDDAGRILAANRAEETCVIELDGNGRVAKAKVQGKEGSSWNR
jgi:hypothetical protein